MNISEDAIIDGILTREGRTYTNHPADRGGPTKFGITLATLAGWRGRAQSAADVEALTEPEARAIYRAEFIQRPKFALIADARLRLLIIDCGVHHGQPTAALWLQEALNRFRPQQQQIGEDGVIGNETLAALAEAEAHGVLGDVYDRVLARRFKRFGSLVTNDPRQLDNLNGWLNRACYFLTEM